jgi:2-polyprenyl-3-methyl-5-hydroxy-6-metoxy-1,4-benzoquinol methylase
MPPLPTPCRTCQGSAPTEAALFSGFHTCARCGITFKSPFPTAEELTTFYRQGWTAPDHNLSATGEQNLPLTRRYAAALARSLGKEGFSGTTILDYGAGRGAMSQALAERSAVCTAVEPYGYEHLARIELGAHRSLEEIPAAITFDGIVLMDVIEHLLDPWAVVEQLSTRLKTGGWLLVTTPNAQGMMARLKRDAWSEIGNPGHIALYTRRSLADFLIVNGFRRVLPLRWIIDYDGSPLRTQVQKLMQLFGCGGQLRMLAFK